MMISKVTRNYYKECLNGYNTKYLEDTGIEMCKDLLNTIIKD